MITLAKAITNGAQPMGAVAVSDDIYNTIINSGPEHGVESVSYTHLRAHET